MSKKLPNLKTDFPQWYQEVIYKSELADLSPVRGSIVIRPYGYAIWEHIKAILDKKIKETGHQNALFPLLIPQSFLQKEAKHVEGFSPELAVVTHAGDKELEEPLVIRPTSETIIHYMFAKWIKSWRDLPLKINHWANVMRWELRPRPFLRTTEFYWQEGHTAHETAKEAEDEAKTMLAEYKDLLENYLAIPVIEGLKSPSEQFAGADKTFTIEALMPDGKALQVATSHLISQNFAKAFGIQFQDRNGKLQYPYLTSWGATTRLIGALVMVHGDQNGLIIPPKIAPYQVVIIPILKKGSDTEKIKDLCHTLAHELKPIRVLVDDDETITPGAKFYNWELKGVPLRIEIGPKDIEKNQVTIVDRLSSEKKSVSMGNVKEVIEKKLDEIQHNLFDRAKKRLQNLWFKRKKLEDFSQDIQEVGGLYQTGWCGSAACEEKLKPLKATIRCLIPENEFKECFSCNKKSSSDILVARSY